MIMHGQLELQHCRETLLGRLWFWMRPAIPTGWAVERSGRPVSQRKRFPPEVSQGVFLIGIG